MILDQARKVLVLNWSSTGLVERSSTPKIEEFQTELFFLRTSCNALMYKRRMSPVTGPLSQIFAPNWDSQIAKNSELDFIIFGIASALCKDRVVEFNKRLWNQEINLRHKLL